jgi:hypothetical protein
MGRERRDSIHPMMPSIRRCARNGRSAQSMSAQSSMRLHGGYGQYMTSWRNKVVVAASLHDVGDRSAIDLKIENYVPSKVRGPQNDQTPT